MMKIAFSGPSGLGKSTLCKIVQDSNPNIKWLSTSAGDILSGKVKEALEIDYGYKGTGHKDVINLSCREPDFGRDFQTELLIARISQISRNDNFVIDRCPIDNVVYMLTQVGHNFMEAYCDDFIKQAQETFQKLTHVIIIAYSSDIPIIEDNKSRIPNKFYQQYISDVFMGVYTRYFANLVGPQVIILDTWDLTSRSETVQTFLENAQ